MNNMYDLVISTISDMKIGTKTAIEIPDNLPYFRKYLCEISKRYEQRFTTKIINGKLEVMRVKYHNIYSKEVE